jgi:hypothetical protein
MSVDIDAARAFVVTHGRLIDRRRVDLLLDGGDPEGVLAALDGYRNPDGGFGWGLEPDLRAPESQPVGAMHAFEVLAEIAPMTTSRSAELCDWLDANALAGGGLPLALPVSDGSGCAALWLDAAFDVATLQMTAQVAANAHHVASHDPAVRDHPWLARATAWSMSAIARLDGRPDAHTLMFAVRFLDAVAHVEPDATELLDRLAVHIPRDGVVTVVGGVEGEALRLLDLAPRHDGAARRLFDSRTVEHELARLAAAQQPDGGWTVDFESASPAAALEWRAYATVNNLRLLDPAERTDRPPPPRP